MHATTIAEERLLVKRAAAKMVFRHSASMAGRPRKVKPLEPSSDLHRLFLRRIREEKSRLGITVDSDLKNRNESGLPQRTISDTLGKQADPKLLTVSRLARALGVQAWELFVEREEAERMKISTHKTIPAVTKVLIPGSRSQGKPGRKTKATEQDEE